MSMQQNILTNTLHPYGFSDGQQANNMQKKISINSSSSKMHLSLSASRKNSIKDNQNSSNQLVTTNLSQRNDNNSQPRVKSLIPKPTPKQSQKQPNNNTSSLFSQSKTFDNSTINNTTQNQRPSIFSQQQQQQQKSQLYKNKLLFSSQTRQQQQYQQNSATKNNAKLNSNKLIKDTNQNNHLLQLTPDPHRQHNNKKSGSYQQYQQEIQKARQQFSQTLLPTQMLAHDNNSSNNCITNSNSIITSPNHNNVNINNEVVQNFGQEGLQLLRSSDLSTNALSTENNTNNNVMPLKIASTASNDTSLINNVNSHQQQQQRSKNQQQTNIINNINNSNNSNGSQVRQLKQPTQFTNNKTSSQQQLQVISHNGNNTRSSLNAVYDRTQQLQQQQQQQSLQNQYGIKPSGQQSRVQSANNIKSSSNNSGSNLQSHQNNQVYQQKLLQVNQATDQKTQQQQKRPLSSNNASSSSQMVLQQQNQQQHLQVNKYSKIGNSINTALQALDQIQPKSTGSNAASDKPLPKPHPSSSNTLTNNNQKVQVPVSISVSQQSQSTPKNNTKNLEFNNQQQLSNVTATTATAAVDIPLQINRLQETLQKSNNNNNENLSQKENDKVVNNIDKVKNSHSANNNNNNQDQNNHTNANTNSFQYDQKDFFSNRTSCYDREEMDEKYQSNNVNNQSQCYKIVHPQNQQNMLKEITNLLKGSQSRATKQSMLNSRHSNDYSITQFNMNTITTPYHNETLSNLGSGGGQQRLPSTVIPNELSLAASFLKSPSPPSVLSGEENIQNDESPHKCHSIKTYHISTFFNKECQIKFLNFLNQHPQLRQSNQQNQYNYYNFQQQQQQLQNYQPINPSTFNYDYLRTYPKMNFQVPEQKCHENISVSQYETPINQSIPIIYNVDNTTLNHTQQIDMSVLTNSCLNISQHPQEMINLYGQGVALPSKTQQIQADFGQNNHKKIHNFNNNNNNNNNHQQTQQQQQQIQHNNSNNELDNTQIQHQLNINTTNPTNNVIGNGVGNNGVPQGSHIKVQNCLSISENDITSSEINETTQMLSVRQNQNIVQNAEIHRQHLIQTFNALQTIPLLGPYQKSYLRKERIYLPPPRDPSLKKVLILDIDETMIHCLDERDPETEEPDVVIRIPLDDEGDYADAGINIRPHLYECLRQVNQYYQVITFTASDQQYANAILDFIDPDKSLIQYRLYRQHCIETEFGYIKDLRVIANRDLKDMVLVDNSVLSFAMQIENGIPILPYYVSKQDEELLHLVYYLKCLVIQEDVRSHNREAFGLNKLALMDIHQIMKNTTTNADGVDGTFDQINLEENSIGEPDNDSNSSHSSNTAPDEERDNDNDTYSDSDGMMLSPNTKINNVKQKYQPNDMDLINEESMESDLTSSIMSKRLIGIQINKQKQQQQKQQHSHQNNINNQNRHLHIKINSSNSNSNSNSNKTNNSLQNISNSNIVNQSFNNQINASSSNNNSKLQQIQHQQISGTNKANITSSSNAFENYQANSIKHETLNNNNIINSTSSGSGVSHHIQQNNNSQEDYYQINNNNNNQLIRR